MVYVAVGLVSFLLGYGVCFKWFKKDIVEGKPIAFNEGVYVASKAKIEP
ncbi:hypothetical protein HYG93_05605 [Acinetobacter sp. SwsAc6]|nr:hypothetical protein [Acinetobacter sp. SwsAc6]NWK73773.1 hypothetical protein [Acinetobacter sp. SwsAc6]